MTSFPRRATKVYHFAELIGYPSGGGGQTSGVSDRTGTIATNIASGRSDDPSVFVARKLDKWLERTLGEIRHLDSEMRKCEAEEGFKVEDLDKCEICKRPRAITHEMILGKCRSCYNKEYRDSRKGKK
jgi:hypothetical protein